MAFRLGEYVVYGEVFNRHNYATHGTIALRGDTPDKPTLLRLDLTGNCDPDVQGKAFRFWPGEEDASDAVFRMDAQPGFQDRQIGPTGTMTAQGWVRAMPLTCASTFHPVTVTGCSGMKYCRRRRFSIS